MNIERILTGILLTLPISLTGQPSQPTLSQPIQTQLLVQGAAQVDLRNHFGVPGITGQVVQFVTTAGRINVELYSADAPRHVANFLGSVSEKTYDGSIIHRVDPLGTQVPAAVEGGRFKVGLFPADVPGIPVGPTLPTEYKWPNTRGTPLPEIAVAESLPTEYKWPNTRGTLAAGRAGEDPGNPVEWFFNTIDQSEALGPGNRGGYTVLGRVLGAGMNVVDAIAQLPIYDLGVAAALNRVPLRNLNPTQKELTLANFVIVESIRPIPIYPPSLGDPTAVLSFTVTTNAPSVVAAQITGTTLTLTPLMPGSANVTVQARDANGTTSAPSTFSVVVPANALLAPIFTSQPQSQSAPAGSTVVLNAFASGGNSFFATSYRWFRNGVALGTADSSYLVLRGINAGHEGSYHCVATNALGSTPSSAATLTVLPAVSSDQGRFANLAIHTLAGTEDFPLIVGFIVGGDGGSAAQPLLMRAMGPSLSQFGVDGVLDDPVIALFRNETLLARNDDWSGDAQIAQRSREVGAFGFASAASLDAACAYSLSPGPYTFHVYGKPSASGLTLAEIYDGTVNRSRPSPRLINVSARATLTADRGQLVAGFVVQGSSPLTVLIRAVGPTLAGYGVQGALVDPKLQVFQGSFLLRSNDNWAGDPQLASVTDSLGAFPLADRGSRDAALLLTLQPGNYTAHVTPADGGEGIALVEVWEFR